MGLQKFGKLFGSTAKHRNCDGKRRSDPLRDSQLGLVSRRRRPVGPGARRSAVVSVEDRMETGCGLCMRSGGVSEADRH
jgi:hypothetical protein